jgi:hypothetical protein
MRIRKEIKGMEWSNTENLNSFLYCFDTEFSKFMKLVKACWPTYHRGQFEKYSIKLRNVKVEKVLKLVFLKNFWQPIQGPNSKIQASESYLNENLIFLNFFIFII